MVVLDLTTALVFLLVFIIAYLVISAPKNLPPGPRGWPIIGNMLEFNGSKGKLPEIFLNYYKKFGNVFIMHYGSVPVVVVNGYDLVDEILVKKSAVFKDRPDFLWYLSKIRTGVIMSNGQKWKDLRRLTLRALRDFGMGRIAAEEKIRDEITVTTGILAEMDQRPVKISNYLDMATANVICNIIFGSRFEYTDDKFREMIRLSQGVFNTPGMFQICNAFPIFRFLPKFKKAMVDKIYAFDQLSDFVRGIVEEHEISYDKDNPRDFIDMYITLMREEDLTSFSLLDFLGLIIDLFMAGAETSSTTLKWSLLYMMANPDIQKKCQEEIDTVIGPGRMVTYADRMNLPYVEAAIMEVQRLASISPLSVPHATLQNTSLAGYTIPQDSVVFPNLMSVHLSPEKWPEPEVFKPERFLKDGKVFKPEAFMPFSTGPRACAGETLAKMELFLYFANLLQCFTIKKPEGQTLSMEGFTGLTRSPKPFEMIVIKR